MRVFASPLLMFNASAKFAALLLGCLLFSVRADAGQATLAWDASASPAVAGYMVYYGTSSGTYSGKADAGTQTTYTVKALRDGQNYFYAVTAYDSGRAESAFSSEANATLSGSAPVATQASAGGGGGGCTTGASTTLDPTFPILLFVAAYSFLHRKRNFRRARSSTNVSGPDSRYTKVNDTRKISIYSPTGHRRIK